MYAPYFGLTEPPFSITPNPRYLYMSGRHREAMAHLIYGLRETGGFVQLTGEVGTGKTTLCRCMMLKLPKNVDVALILNPRIDEIELLATICDELRVPYPSGATVKNLIDRLNHHLLQAHAQGRRTVLVIDEAQNLSKGVLEQIRLLTNLETSRRKLLQIILVGQTELIHLLNRRDLRQLAQRITARYHLLPLSAFDTRLYVRYRLAVAGRRQPLFSNAAYRQVYRSSQGVPRLINVICDRALLGAYANDQAMVTAATVRAAAREIFGHSPRRWSLLAGRWLASMSGALLAPLTSLYDHCITRGGRRPQVLVPRAAVHGHAAGGWLGRQPLRSRTMPSMFSG